MARKGGNSHETKELEEILYQIQETMKIENGNDMILNKQVETFINTVNSLQDQHESGISLKEEKALLIAGSKAIERYIELIRVPTKTH